MDEYKSLRDETLKRVEFRNQLWNFTLLSAGTAFTIGASKEGTAIALFAYPVVVLFFAAAFSYNTMLLINLGSYIREVVEPNVTGLGWATYLKDTYSKIERLEHLAKYGLFVGTEILMVGLAYYRLRSRFETAEWLSPEWLSLVVGLAATLATARVLHLPEAYHRQVLARPHVLPNVTDGQTKPAR